MRIAAVRPELLAEARRLVALDGACDPATEAALVNLVNTYLRRERRELAGSDDK